MPDKSVCDVGSIKDLRNEATWRGEVSSDIKTLFKRSDDLSRIIERLIEKQDARFNKLLWTFIVAQGAVLIAIFNKVSF